MSSFTDRVKAYHLLRDCIPKCTPSGDPCIHVDVSCNCEPIINVDVSCNPTVNVDVSVNPIVAIDLSSTNAYLATLTNMDAFARLRVSNPYTLFEFNSISPDSSGGNTYRLYQQTTGSGTATHSLESYVEMSVGPTAGSVIRQSREYIPYQPGKSKLVYMTGVLYMNAGATAGITTRIGCFDASMGIYIQMSNGVISVVEDNITTTTVPRSSWTDPLDGTGPSGVTVDFTKAQIFMFDFEWLGVGQVRCAIIQAGVIHYYYTFTHVNTLTAPYIQMAKLPLRYEIIGTGAATNSMRMICGTAISEGGVSPIGRKFIYGNNLSSGVAITGNNPAKLVPIFGLRLKPVLPQSRATLKIKQVDIANTNTTSVCSWVLLVNPTYTTPPTWTDYSPTYNTTSIAASSSVQIGTFANPDGSPVTGGHIILSGFVVSRDQSAVLFSTDELIAAFALGSNIAGNVTDEAVLAVNVITSSGGNPAIFAFMEWLELL